MDIAHLYFSDNLQTIYKRPIHSNKTCKFLRTIQQSRGDLALWMINFDIVKWYQQFFKLYDLLFFSKEFGFPPLPLQFHVRKSQFFSLMACETFVFRPDVTFWRVKQWSEHWFRCKKKTWISLNCKEFGLILPNNENYVRTS